MGAGTRWVLKNEKGEDLISIVGGALGLYGNGKTTFEMWDYNEEQPQGHLTIDEINKHLDKFHNKPNRFKELFLFAEKIAMQIRADDWTTEFREEFNKKMSEFEKDINLS